MFMSFLRVLRELLQIAAKNPAKPFTPIKVNPVSTAPVMQRVSSFVFGSRSRRELDTADTRLQRVARRALELTIVDFGVLEGERSMADQRKAVASGASKTLNSKHLHGNAIDVGAYIGSKLSWEGEHYLKIATAFVYAADELGVPIRWGGAWNIPDIRACAHKELPGETMVELYKQHKREAGGKVFLDLGHFELA